jgi:glutathione synthase/RimK-type ligase-like ATP-grasp enzyme
LPEKRFKNDRAFVNPEKISPTYKDEDGHISKDKAVNESIPSNKRRSYSTTDSSSKVGMYHGNVTSRLNAINIKPKKKDKIVINLKYTQYDVLSEVAKEVGFKITRTDKTEYDVIWFDLPPVANILSKLQKFQRINHFPGMNQVANKSNLARNLERMAKVHPNGYSFFPKTWIVPSELHELKKYAKENSKDTFIIKPEMMSQGKGIYLTKNVENLSKTNP